LLELGEETILDHLISRLERFPTIDGIVIVSSSRFYMQFVAWQTRTKHCKTIQIIENGVCEPEKRKGAVRDLELALMTFRGTPENFLVFCGDNYFDFPLGYFLLPCLGHHQAGFVGIYDVKDKSIASQYGVVGTDAYGKIVRFEEKPRNPISTRVSIGIYYLPAAYRLRIYEYLEIEKNNPDRIGDFIAWLSKKEPLYGVDFNGAWFDIGTVESYAAARKYLNTAEHGMSETQCADSAPFELPRTVPA
jgi:NDP-sugar pyrophosphorylase family protein